MKELEERIKKDGKIFPGDVLKVDNFLNHQIDPMLLESMGKEWHRLFKDEKVDKVLTIEASGIAMAIFVAKEFGVPLLFAKKSKTINISDDVFRTDVVSYTHGRTYAVQVSKEYLHKGERVLIIDDFLATGNALKGLIELCNLAGAEVVGLGCSVEKTYQQGGNDIRNMGYRVECLARVASMDPEKGIEFVD